MAFARNAGLIRYLLKFACPASRVVQPSGGTSCRRRIVVAAVVIHNNVIIIQKI